MTLTLRYAISRNRCFRVSVLLISIALMLFTPIFITYEMKIYMDDNSVHQNLHTYRAESITYPNITICNPRFFKNEYLRSKRTVFGSCLYVVRIQHIHLLFQGITFQMTWPTTCFWLWTPPSGSTLTS